MNIDEIITKEIACQPDIATGTNGRGGVSTSQAMDMNVTIDGPVCIKHNKIIIPIDVFYFSTFNHHKKRVILNRNTFQVVQLIKQ